jgi:hypothetical protein
MKYGLYHSCVSLCFPAYRQGSGHFRAMDKLSIRGDDITILELFERANDIAQCTLHQGAIEAIFLDSIQKFGIEVRRPIVPVSIKLDEAFVDRHDVDTYPVEVKHNPRYIGQKLRN